MLCTILSRSPSATTSHSPLAAYGNSPCPCLAFPRSKKSTQGNDATKANSRPEEMTQQKKRKQEHTFLTPLPRSRHSLFFFPFLFFRLPLAPQPLRLIAPGFRRYCEKLIVGVRTHSVFE